MNKKMVILMAIGLFSVPLMSFASAKPDPSSRQFYEIKVFHIAEPGQLELVHHYLQRAFIPFMNKLGIQHIGVFEEIEPKDSTDHKIYVFVPFQSLQQWESIPPKLYSSPGFQEAAGNYWNGPADHPPYVRMENILLKAFPDMPVMKVPELQSPKSQRVYELRSYESPNEKFGLNKINMFNEGGEVTIFKTLHFNAVFYAQVLSGSHMPNLMYMTTFENMASREEHWKAFGSNPDWKSLSAMDKYQKNVSKAEITFLHPVEYSQL